VAPKDPWLTRQNAALKLKGHGVSLDVAGHRLRLRATMPPKPADPPGGEPKQRRISTGLSYPDQAAEALVLAERLGNALERHRVGVEPFDWNPWLPSGKVRGIRAVGSQTSAGVSGIAALRQTRNWWDKQRVRGASAEDSWKVDYQDPLAPLMEISELTHDHLLALVGSTTPGSRTRRRISQAAATVARALAWPDSLVTELRDLGKGYSASRSQVPRELPTNDAIVDLIDQLSVAWQWPVAVTAVYGCRPHEALLYSEIQESGLLRVSDGKTGARQSLALPVEWIERWDLKTKRLPAFNPERTHRQVGSLMGQALRRAGASFKAYDLRHAWAVRAIHTPEISPSLAAKSMGHSLAIHSSVYQRWFDAYQMEVVQIRLSSVA
jgi:integrase